MAVTRTEGGNVSVASFTCDHCAAEVSTERVFMISQSTHGGKKWQRETREYCDIECAAAHLQDAYLSYEERFCLGDD